MLRFTCSLSLLFSTPYKMAKSKSNITCCPRITLIKGSILIVLRSQFATSSCRLSCFVTTLTASVSLVFFAIPVLIFKVTIYDLESYSTIPNSFRYTSICLSKSARLASNALISLITAWMSIGSSSSKVST